MRNSFEEVSELSQNRELDAGRQRRFFHRTALWGKNKLNCFSSFPNWISLKSIRKNEIWRKNNFIELKRLSRFQEILSSIESLRRNFFRQENFLLFFSKMTISRRYQSFQSAKESKKTFLFLAKLRESRKSTKSDD